MVLPDHEHFTCIANDPNRQLLNFLIEFIELILLFLKVRLPIGLLC